MAYSDYIVSWTRAATTVCSRSTSNTPFSPDILHLPQARLHPQGRAHGAALQIQALWPDLRGPARARDQEQTAPFAFLQSQATRAVFMDDLNRIMVQAPMTIVAAIIHKSRLVQRYIRPEYPDEIALLFCIERLFRISRRPSSHRGDDACRGGASGRKEDAALELEFRRICDGGNRWGRKKLPGYRVRRQESKFDGPTAGRPHGPPHWRDA